MSESSTFFEQLSPWMKNDAPNNEIVVSSRIRLARNLDRFVFPIFSTKDDNRIITDYISSELNNSEFKDNEKLHIIKMKELDLVDQAVLVEKHLVSPLLVNEQREGIVFISSNEHISIMINEEDHIRVQCMFPGLQLQEALILANQVDDWIEKKIDYAYDEKYGYLTSCPSNVGTGLRASVMLHLPALVMTNQITSILPTINQLGFAVRGIYGEGSDALGNMFQISNQITLGKREEEIVEDLTVVVERLVEQEKYARNLLQHSSAIKLQDQLLRSFGILRYAKIIPSKEAATCLSDVLLGVDLGYIQNLSSTNLKELMILTQPGFLQKKAGRELDSYQRDVFRANLIQELLNLQS